MLAGSLRTHAADYFKLYASIEDLEVIRKILKWPAHSAEDYLTDPVYPDEM